MFSPRSIGGKKLLVFSSIPVKNIIVTVSVRGQGLVFRQKETLKQLTICTKKLVYTHVNLYAELQLIIVKKIEFCLLNRKKKCKQIGDLV